MESADGGDPNEGRPLLVNAAWCMVYYDWYLNVTSCAGAGDLLCRAQPPVPRARGRDTTWRAQSPLSRARGRYTAIESRCMRRLCLVSTLVPDCRLITVTDRLPEALRFATKLSDKQNAHTKRCIKAAFKTLYQPSRLTGSARLRGPNACPHCPQLHGRGMQPGDRNMQLCGHLSSVVSA